MAAGRNGIYGEDDVVERESGYISRPNSNGRIRKASGSSRYERDRIVYSDARDKGRVRHIEKDIRIVDRSSKNDPGSSVPIQPEISVRVVDREPGELSSESGSDEGHEATDSSSQATVHISLTTETKTQSPLHDKKRKFSPIIWNKDRDSSSNMSNGLPPPPPRPKSYVKSPNHILPGNMHIDLPQNTEIKISKPSPSLDIVCPPSSTASASPVSIYSSLLDEPFSHHDQAAEKPDDEDYVPTRTIKSSRWENVANSPVDEGEISDDPADKWLQKRRKNIPRSISPELGKIKSQGSEGSRSRSKSDLSESEDNDNEENGSNEKDYIVIDRKHGTSDSQPDTDSENESDSSNSPPQRCFNMLQGCRSVDEFERLNKIDEGTYGVVFRARDKKTGEIVALKKVKMEKEREGFPMTALREINILLSFHHSSIVDVKEVVVGSNLDSIFMVMEYMEHDLKALIEMKKHPFSQSEVKCLMLQLLEGVNYLHDNWVLHRDLKTSNILLNNRGELKICDFGMARQYGSPLKPYTQLVVTLWYRAPELLLGAKQYTTAIDMWSLGCIMAELLSKEPLFNGRTEVDQLDKIFRTLGTPNETIWPGFSKLPGVKVNFVKQPYNLLRKKFPAASFTTSPVLSEAGFDLLNRLLTYDPAKRITAEDALNHAWFREVPLPTSKDFMPTFPAQHAQDRRTRKMMMKSPDPLEEQRRKELQQGEYGTGGLFGQR